VEMKYEHNEAYDKTVGEIVRRGYGCEGIEYCSSVCPLANICLDNEWDENSITETKERVIEYIAEEVAEFSKNYGYNVGLWQMLTAVNYGLYSKKYPVNTQTAKEIADAARVLLKGGYVVQEKQFELKEDQPTIADAFFVYNSDLEKCITVSREQGDDIIDMTIHNEMDIATARVFCEKLSSFLRFIGGEK
jgi:ferredoxin